jgi:hypothetical protein
MSVKRYDYIGQGDCEMAEFDNGPYVRYEDYAALEADKARLEAELTRLKEFIERRIAEFKKGPLSNYGEGKRDAYNIALREIERTQESQAGGR